jgi:hypothetical protein
MAPGLPRRAMFLCSHRGWVFPIDTPGDSLVRLNRFIFTAFQQYAGTDQGSFWGWTMGTTGIIRMPAARRPQSGAKLLPMMLLTGLLLAGPARLLAQSNLTQSDIYCAGFYTQRPVETGLIVQSSEDGGFKNELASGDYVYLNRGTDVITGSEGGQYTVIRPVKDVNRKEAFAGQRMLLQQMGTLYAEVGRLEIEVLHDQSVTAKILMACDSINPGDIAIPFNARTAPSFKTPHMTNRFAALSGKATGTIAAAKDYDDWLGEGKIVYMNLGSAQGLQPGNYLYVTRSYMGGGNAEFAKAAHQYPTEFNGTSMGRKLTAAEEAALPREVLGEVMVLSVQEGSATGIITYSRAEIGVGDSVELE